MTKSLHSRLDRLYAARAEKAIAAQPRAPIDLLKGTFAQQRAFITDPAKMRWALCTRRAAKTYSVGTALMKTASEHEGSCLYLGLTRESAKRILWQDVLKAINSRHGAGFKFNESSLVAQSPLGSPIYLVGADSNEDEKKKALGQKYRMVVVDEAQAWTIDLRELVYGILKPAVADYRGTIIVAGTPGNFTKGFFHDLTKGCRAGHVGPEELRERGWSAHSWTTFDNPYMAKQWGEEIEDLKKANPAVVDTPWFRQNYLGEWVIESDSLVYRYNSDRNSFRGGLPSRARGTWHYVLAVDLGFEDACAFVVLAYHDYDKKLYIIKAEKESKLDITATAQRIRLYQRWLKMKFQAEFDVHIVDGANKQAVEEMRKRHNLPLRAAEKTGKADFIDIMNGEYIAGNILVSADEAAPLTAEYAELIWDERSLEKQKREEHPACENHLADAALYGWRYCFSYLAEKAPVDLPEEDKLELEAEKHFEERQRAAGDYEWHQQ